MVEDGPTLTHGGTAFGAGFMAARNYGASEMVNPRPFSVGSIKEVFEKYKPIGKMPPAINKADCDLVIVATSLDLRRLIKINTPSTSVSYEHVDKSLLSLRTWLTNFYLI